jgi:hypothetical protein
MTSAIVRCAWLYGVASLGGCVLAQVDVDVPQTCVTDTGLQVPANVPAFPQESFTFNQLGELQTLASEGFSITLASGRVHADSGISDLGFVDQATISLASGQGSSALQLMDAFDCGPCVATGATLSLTPASGADLAPYVAGGSVVVDIDIVGQLPAVAWSLDVEVCVAVSGSKPVAD